MIEYRIFRFESERGVLGVEYGPPGSGLTVPIEIFNHVKVDEKITPEVLHKLCVTARPKDAINRFRRMSALVPEDLATIQASLNVERTISDEEEKDRVIRGRIPVVDTSK
jgi:hypothetical protein